MAKSKMYIFDEFCLDKASLKIVFCIWNDVDLRVLRLNIHNIVIIIYILLYYTIVVILYSIWYRETNAE